MFVVCAVPGQYRTQYYGYVNGTYQVPGTRYIPVYIYRSNGPIQHCWSFEIDWSQIPRYIVQDPDTRVTETLHFNQHLT